MSNITWLLIGAGLGIILGKEDVSLILLGIGIFSVGFIMLMVEDRERLKQKIKKEALK